MKVIKLHSIKVRAQAEKVGAEELKNNTCREKEKGTGNAVQDEQIVSQFSFIV
jgi:hypothetical protein